MHYYQHHIGDFTRDTARLNDAQCMAYLRLIWSYYDTEQPLADDPEGLAFSIGASTSDVLQILKHYFVLEDGVWRNPRCDREIQAYRERSEKAKRSASSRWSAARPSTQKAERKTAPTKTEDEQQASAAKPAAEKTERPVSMQRPDGVSPQTWSDWLALRKAKKAPVTATVVEAARREAEKAGMPLDAFLQVWCMRGSQGLQADWIKPHERDTQPRTWAQATADIARTTVPGRQGRDPALLALEEDDRRASPIPEEVRRRMESLLPKRRPDGAGNGGASSRPHQEQESP